MTNKTTLFLVKPETQIADGALFAWTPVHHMSPYHMSEHVHIRIAMLHLTSFLH